MENIPRAGLTGNFVVLAALFSLRAAVNYGRERVGFIAGSMLRCQIRAQVLDRLERLGPAWIRGKPAGSWSSMLLEQIEDMHDYYARYLPQISLSLLVPLIILIVVFSINWAAGLILLLTAPLIPLFMALVGMGAADANRRNFLALARLSGYFLDRLRGLETLRLFFRAEAETEDMHRATEVFRQRTMEVLRLAFLSSGVLEFFASISIAVAAVYFGFSYLGELHFGSYGTGVTLFSGFLVLILAPEFFQPLRDLGTFYHAKAKAVGAAESLVSFLEHDDPSQGTGQETPAAGPVSFLARDLWVLAPDGNELAGPLNFSVAAGQRVGIVGTSGAGKSSLLGVLLGFLPYRGSLQVNGRELRALSLPQWRERLSWVSQSPALPAETLRANILLGTSAVTDSQLTQALNDAYVTEFLKALPDGLESAVGEDAGRLSVGQAQRVVLARALIRNPGLLLLDEPTASLDIQSERLVMSALENATRQQTTLLVTHQLQVVADFDVVWVMAGGIIAQQGRYADLATSDGLLADLIVSQAQELRHGVQFALGIALAIVTLLASISLLTLSGWFLAGAATVGAAGLYSYNYMLPAAGVRGAAITRTAVRWAELVVSHDATFRVLQNLRLYTFRRILPLSPGAIVRFRQAELLNRLVADVDTLDHLYLRVISPLAGALVVTLTVTVSLSLLDTQSGLGLGAMILVILALFPPLFYRAGKPVGEALTALRAEYRLRLNCWLSGNAELTLYGAAKRYRHQLDATEQRWQKHQRRQSGLGAGAQSLLLVLTGLTLTLVLWLAAGGVGDNGSAGALIALFAFATLAAFETLGPVAGAFQHLGQVLASAARLNVVINQSPEVVFPTAGPAPAASVALSVRRVRFHYPGQAVPAIDDLSLTVAAGEHIGLLGHTGSGKSTLLQLLTRAWDPDKGDIALNGVPLREWSESALRAMTAVVPQRVHIFSATLRDNLRLAARDADDEQLCQVLRLVGLENLLAGEGVNAWFGEGGRALSGGELRRIGIARALLHCAPLWLFDEPTEGLDVVTEQQILQLLTTLSQGRTVIIVTHRLRGLERLNRICIMDRGNLIEQGSHHALMAQRGRYYHYHRPIEIDSSADTRCRFVSTCMFSSGGLE